MIYQTSYFQPPVKVGVGMFLLRIFRFSDLWLPTSEPEGFLVGVWLYKEQISCR